MKETSKILQLYAYYLSKYDMQAVTALGYTNRSQAFSDIGAVFDRDNHYLKLRRDEFDVLTGSHRQGWNKRPVTKRVQELFDYYEQFSFDELTEMAREILKGHRDISTDIPPAVPKGYSETELEAIINYQDTTAAERLSDAYVKQRVLYRGIIDNLKKLYGCKCQLCGSGFKDTYGVDFVEAHHIIPFAESLNNDASNLVILCPNHHRLIHATKATFDRDSCTWDFHNGHVERLALDYHLGKHSKG